MSDRYGISQGVAVIIRNDSSKDDTHKILLVLRAKNLHYMGGYWSFPVGHVEAFESPSKAMVRELHEELGVHIASSKLKPLLTIHTPPESGEGPEGQRTDTYFEASVSDIENDPKNMEPDRCEEIRWFPENQLPDNFMPRQKAALRYIKAGRTYVEEE